jgi:DDE superfamily endonuclease
VARRVEPGISRARPPARPDRRGVDRPAHAAHDSSAFDISPFGHEGTERPIPRPKDPEEQEEYSSGKQKRHTRKNLLVIQETGHLAFLSPTYAGQASEKSMAASTGDALPAGRWLDQDKGFQGFFVPGMAIVQPKKTPPGGELTPPEPATTRQLSSMRMRIEPAMGGVKRSRSVKDTIRLLRDGLRDAVMEPWCGLHTFRLWYRPWNYAHS